MPQLEDKILTLNLLKYEGKYREEGILEPTK